MGVSIRIWEQDGVWEWDIRWPGPPKMRSTGSCPTLAETLAAVAEDVATASR